MKKALLILIRIYQRTVSFDTGFLGRIIPLKVCRYTPTCSQYTYEAIERYGIIAGLRMGFLRILRCNPWIKGGWDPVK
jgi:hypothetical protein